MGHDSKPSNTFEFLIHNPCKYTLLIVDIHKVEHNIHLGNQAPMDHLSQHLHLP